MLGNRLRRFRWLEVGVIPFIVAVMRVAWMVPVIQLALNNAFVHPTDLVMPAWWLLVLLLAPGVLSQWHLPEERARLVSVTLGLAAIPITWWLVLGTDGQPLFAWFAAQVLALTDWRLGIPNALVLASLAVLIWQRGTSAKTVHYEELWRGFVWGSVALSFMMLFREQTLEALPGSDIVGSVVVFILSGLMALALLALTGTLATENPRSTGRLGISRHWVATVGSAVGAILLLGWAIGLLLAPDTLARWAGYLKPLWDLLVLALLAIATLLAYLILWLVIPVLQAIYNRIAPMLQRDALGELRRFLIEDMEIAEREPPALGPIWEIAWRPLFLSILIGTAIWLIVRAWRRRAEPENADILETRESIMTPALLRKQIQGLFKPRRTAPSPYLPLDPEHSSRDAIRAAYQSLLGASRIAGLPRPRGATPYRYDELLRQRWPENRRALAALAALYTRARYGDQDPAPADVAQAQQALDELRTAEMKLAARE